jgi:DNA-binding NarL/FixJ family response regulator
MIALALYAADPVALRRLQHLTRGLRNVAVLGEAASPSALTSLLGRVAVDIVLADLADKGDLTDWQAPARHATLVAIVDDGAEEGALDALASGAVALLPRSFDASEVASAIELVAQGFAVMPRALLGSLLAARGPGAPLVALDDAADGLLTQRELEVLAALADGASNKAIARRLGISFHTVKFHVASILAKLDADSRTEAVAQAARRGLVML